MRERKSDLWTQSSDTKNKKSVHVEKKEQLKTLVKSSVHTRLVKKNKKSDSVKLEKKIDNWINSVEGSKKEPSKKETDKNKPKDKAKDASTKKTALEKKKESNATKEKEDKATKEKKDTSKSSEKKKEASGNRNKKDKNSKKNNQENKKSLVRFVGDQVGAEVKSELGTDDTLIGEAEQVAGHIRATKDGVKATAHMVNKTAKTTVKITKTSSWIIKNRKRIAQASKQQAINVFKAISRFIANPIAVIQGAGIGVIASVVVGVLMIIVVSISTMISSFTIKADEKALTETWSYLTELDTDTTLNIRSGSNELEMNGAYASRENVEIVTTIDGVLAYMDGLYGDYKLDKKLPKKTTTARQEIDSLYQELVTQSTQETKDNISVQEITEIIKNNEKNSDMSDQLAAMAEVGQYASLVELASPFPDSDQLMVKQRFGYYIKDNKKAELKGIIIQSEKGQKVHSPMSGTVVSSGDQLSLTKGKKILSLQGLEGSVSVGTKVKKGQVIGKTTGENSLFIQYTRSGTIVNPGFYFPNVQYLQFTNFGYMTSGSGFNEAVFRMVILTKCNLFSSKADKIIAEAQKAGVSPVIFAAIMIHESAWGTSKAIREHNNPSGQMSSSVIIHYATLDEGIEATGRTLKNLIIERELQTVEALGSVYCPIGAANDPLGLNKNWVPAIKGFMKELGGTEDMSLLWSEASGTAGTMLEFAHSLFGKGVIYSQDTGKRGTFPYHDCSSFVMKAMQEAGLKVGLGSTETLYGLEGTLLQPISRDQVKAGDIFVWGTKGGSGGDYGHTGIFLDDGGKTIIHCTPSVNQNGNVVKTPFDGYYGSPELAPVYFYRIN